MIEITFDPLKDQRNRQKHGISLAQARLFDWAHATYWSDQRRDYHENRRGARGLIGDRLYVLIFVVRDEKHRIISLRKANAREVRCYELQR